MTVQNQRANVATACAALAPVALEHELVVSHGNGPQVGLLALQAAAYDEASDYPFDVLGAQTEGMIGYLIEQELGNLLPFEKPLATILTMTEVDPDDPAFADPTKFVGPVYTDEEAQRLAAAAWLGREARRRVLAPGGARRRCPPASSRSAPVEWLLTQGCVVICAGGGGIPTMYRPGTRTLVGVEAVIDKDRASAVLARDLAADLLVIATDADAVYLGWGTPEQKAVATAHPDDLEALPFAAGLDGAEGGGGCRLRPRERDRAVIGALSELPALLAGTAGTRVTTAATGVTFRAGG